MLSRSEAVEIATRLLDRQPAHSYVADGLDLARFVVFMFGDGAMAHEANNLTAVQARCTELLEQVRQLRREIETVNTAWESVSPEEQKALVKSLLTTVLAMR